MIHRFDESVVGEKKNLPGSVVWTVASQAIFQGRYFLICKKLGPDSMIAKVTSSSVNSTLLKTARLLQGEHLQFLDNGAQGVFMPTSDHILTFDSNESGLILR